MSSLVMGGRGSNRVAAVHLNSSLIVCPMCTPSLWPFYSLCLKMLEKQGVGGSPWEETGEAGLSEKGKSRPCKLPWGGEHFTFASPGGFEHTFFEWT